jgi:predicted metal-dependent enzyme (double-stranded beta helix superfamily)
MAVNPPRHEWPPTVSEDDAMTTDTGTQDTPYKVDVLMNHPAAIVSRIHLAPGAETPRHAHKHDYVVHPHAGAKLVKVTYRGDAVVSEEPIDHKPNEPYYVFKSAAGTSFSLKNVGTSAMLCDKTQIPPPPPKPAG